MQQLPNANPRSRVSGAGGQTSVSRSRVLSDEMIKDWNETELDSVADRVERYQRYFTFTPAQTSLLFQSMSAEILAELDGQRASLRAMDAGLRREQLPTKLSGVCGAIDLGGPLVHAGVVRATSSGGVQLEDVCRCNLTEVLKNKYRYGLADSAATATELFDHLSQMLPPPAASMRIGLSCGFPCDSLGRCNALLVRWTRMLLTARSTNDPVEGSDIGTLLQCALERKAHKGQVAAVINDAVATYVAGNLELASEKSGRNCLMAFVLGSGANAAVVNSSGSIINLEFGAYDKSLPINDVDLEVDFATHTPSEQLFEKMIGVQYLSEICRRVVIKIWQNEAPPAAWQRRTLPWTAAAQALLDQSPELEFMDKVLKTCWEWETTLEVRMTVQRIWDCVFERAAMLAAIAIVSGAKSTGRLQAALGGVACVLGGEMFEQFPSMIERLSRNVAQILSSLLQADASLLSFHLCNQAALKGAGILALSS